MTKPVACHSAKHIAGKGCHKAQPRREVQRPHACHQHGFGAKWHYTACHKRRQKQSKISPFGQKSYYIHALFQKLWRIVSSMRQKKSGASYVFKPTQPNQHGGQNANFTFFQSHRSGTNSRTQASLGAMAVSMCATPSAPLTPIFRCDLSSILNILHFPRMP